MDNDTPTHRAFPSLGEALIWLEETENTAKIQKLRDELLEEARSQLGDHA